MKKFKKMLSVGMMVILFSVSTFSTTASAKTITGEQLGRAFLSGRYLYYAVDMVDYSIMRCDTKTGKKVKIIGTKYKGKDTNGFYEICVKGNYIYALWDQNLGSDAGLPYIYRISKDGKKTKKLAMGKNFIIKNNRIYYTKCKKWIDEYGNVGTKSLGNASMKLDGSGKKSEKNISMKRNTKVLWQTTEKAVESAYTYYLDNGKNEFSPTQLIRENTKTGKKTVIYKTSGQQTIGWAEIRGNSVIISVNVPSGKYKVYYMKMNGKNKILLKSGIAVG